MIDTMTTAQIDDRIDEVTAVLAQMDEIAQTIRGWRDARLESYVLAAFEGRHGGWLGEFERDHLEAYLTELQCSGDESED